MKVALCLLPPIGQKCITTATPGCLKKLFTDFKIWCKVKYNPTIICKACILRESSIQLNNPQVVPVGTAYLLACRLNVSGSSACTAVEMNHI